MNLAAFVTAVVLYCWITRASVTSWGRTPARNSKVGGCPKSPHLLFLGADVVYDDPRPPDEGADIAERLGLKLVREGDHDHLQPRGFPPCKAAAPAAPPGGPPVGAVGADRLS